MEEKHEYTEEERQKMEEAKLESLKRMTGQDAVSVTLDDTFDFECQQCGQCCMNRADIILNPWDVYQMAKHEGVSPLDIVNDYCRVQSGGHSRLPLILLDCDKEEYKHRCPFLILDIKDGCKFKCTIHDCSPGACQNHPIGTAYMCDNDNGIEETSFVKVDQCDNSKGHNNPVKIKDWVKRYTDNIKEITLAHKIQTLATRFFHADEFLFLAAYLERCITEVIENPKEYPEEAVKDAIKQCEFIKTTTGLFNNGTINVGYIQYDISRPFIEQAEENIQELEEMYTVIQEVYRKFRKSVDMPDDVEDVKSWVIRDAMETGVLDRSKLPEEVIGQVKDKIKKGEL